MLAVLPQPLVIRTVYLPWAVCIGIVLVVVASPFHRRVLTLHALILRNKVLIVCVPAIVSLQLLGERAVVSCQLAASRLLLRYLLFQRFIRRFWRHGA